MTSSATLPRASTIFFVSDLHLLARRSEGAGAFSQLHDIVEAGDVLVLGGDIFDFKWSVTDSVQSVVGVASRSLRQLATANVRREIHYVLGNHDADPVWQQELRALAESCENFQVHSIFYRRGDLLFTHGDCIIDRSEALPVTSRPALYHRVYDLIVSLSLHRLIAALSFPRRVTLRRLHRFLSDLVGEDFVGVQYVYFGHTHRRVPGTAYWGRRYYNGGAAIKGCRFEVLRVDTALATGARDSAGE